MRTRHAKMLDVMISIHVPKTGGTTFLKILESVFGAELLLDYRWTHVDLSLDTTEGIQQSLKAVRCIHGHFAFSKYATLRDRDTVSAKFVTWLRDPVDRVVSAYEYLRRREPSRLSPLTPWETAAKEHDIVTFVERGFGVNGQFKQLGRDTLEGFDFVGITEEFSRSLRLFHAMFFPGTDLTPDVEPQRVNPGRAGRNYALDDDVRKAIAACNDRDTALYEKALGKFAELCDEYSIAE